MDTPAIAAHRIATEFKESGSRPTQLVKFIQEEMRNRSLPEQEDFLNHLAKEVRGMGGARSEMEDAEYGGSGQMVLSEAVSKRLGTKELISVNQEQATFLLNKLLPLLVILDQLVWTVWKNIAPESRIKRQSGNILSIPAMIRDLVTQSRSYREDEMDPVFDKTQQLAAGLIGAIGPMGRTYGRKQAAKFSPIGIQDMVKREGTKGPFLGGDEAKCWIKYNELFEDLNEDQIEQEIHQAIVRYTEDLMRGSRT
jgi:hypothetical protein